MNFLNPLILFGLGAAVVPFVIHLLSRRKAKEVVFPSIEFLQRMKNDRMRRLKPGPRPARLKPAAEGVWKPRKRGWRRKK